MKTIEVSNKEIEFIKKAARYLEEPSLLLKLINIVGKPIEKGMNLLPIKIQTIITKATQKSLEKGLSIAISTIEPKSFTEFEKGIENSYWTDWKHTLMTGATGAAGGFFGVSALPIELPVTTGIMLRSIAAIANDFGHDMSSLKIRLECLAVFSMGSPTNPNDDEMESAYFTSRAMTYRLIDEAATWMAKKTTAELAEAIANKSAPVLVRFISQVATRFEIVITEKAMAEALPAIGAVTGTFINMAFSEHFNSVARSHFGIRALEEKYGEEVVRKIYLSYKK